MFEYKKRYIDITLKESLEYMGAISIVGPKWCGKSTTAKEYSNSYRELQDPINGESYRELAEVDPVELLNDKPPVLIDEWQLAPQLWDAVRYLVDKSEEYGKYILTGSTIIDENSIEHSGAGRIMRLMMRPMSLYESEDSNGKISLKELFDNPELNINGIKSELSLDDLLFLSCRGGWPDIFNKKTKKQELNIVKNYLNIICESDASTIDGVKRNPKWVKGILKSYARNVGTLAKYSVMLNDVSEKYGGISLSTFKSYIDVLEKLFVIEDIPAWSPRIKSKTSIRKSPKRLFIDPSIAVAALGLSPERLKQDFKYFGFLFENLCIRDLKVYSQLLDGEIYYYNDKNGLEADAVIVLDDGRYGLIEFKLGPKKIDYGANNLVKLKNLIKEKREAGDIHIPDPSFLAVITGDSIGLTRSDGVKVIPIGCLRA